MAWFALTITGLLEVVWASAMKASDGFKVLGPSILVGVAGFAGFFLLAFAMRTLPLGTAYAVWVGIGALGALAVGIFVYGEPVSMGRLGSAGLVLLGIVGLRLTAGE